MNLYKTLFRPLLFTLSPDNAHRLASFGLRIAGRLPLGKMLTAQLLAYSHPALRMEVGGVNFFNPIGLPGGFDPNAAQAPIYRALGFGFATMGSVTFRTQPGNPRPHFTRLNKDESLIVNKGLMNEGAASVARTIERFRGQGKIDYPLGVSIARTSFIPAHETADDYVASFRLLAPRADYIEINVSCPNVACFTPKEQVKHIENILRKINRLRRSGPPLNKPIWLKVGPDLSDAWNEKIIRICLEQKVDAIVLTNLVKDRSGLSIRSKNWRDQPGGISGKLLAPLAEEKLRYFYRRLKGQIPLISVGGIFTAEDAYRRIQMGATLVQMLTGWIYEGPGVLKKINKKLVRFFERDGFKSLAEAVGAKA